MRKAKSVLLFVFNILAISFLYSQDTLLIDSFPENFGKGGGEDALGIVLVMPIEVAEMCATRKVMVVGKKRFIDMSGYRAYKDSMFNKLGFQSMQTIEHDHYVFTVNKILMWVKKNRWKKVYVRRKEEDE